MPPKRKGLFKKSVELSSYPIAPYNIPFNLTYTPIDPNLEQQPYYLTPYNNPMDVNIQWEQPASPKVTYTDVQPYNTPSPVLPVYTQYPVSIESRYMLANMEELMPFGSYTAPSKFKKWEGNIEPPRFQLPPPSIQLPKRKEMEVEDEPTDFLDYAMKYQNVPNEQLYKIIKKKDRNEAERFRRAFM